jgi:hypothetical protein
MHCGWLGGPCCPQPAWAPDMAREGAAQQQLWWRRGCERLVPLSSQDVVRPASSFQCLRLTKLGALEQAASMLVCAGPAAGIAAPSGRHCSCCAAARLRAFTGLQLLLVT